MPAIKSSLTASCLVGVIKHFQSKILKYLNRILSSLGIQLINKTRTKQINFGELFHARKGTKREGA